MRLSQLCDHCLETMTHLVEATHCYIQASDVNSEAGRFAAVT